MAGEMRRVGVLASAAAAVAVAAAVAAVAPVGSTAAAVAGAARQIVADVQVPINHRINCGGPAVGESANAWTSDEAFTDTSMSKTFMGPPPDSGVLSVLERVLYSVRYVEVVSNVLEYSLPVLPQTEVEVQLVFAEIYHNNSNERVISVELWSGETLLSQSPEFDIVGTVGKYQRYAYTQRVTPIGAAMTVRVVAARGNPVISSIATNVVTAPTEEEVAAARAELIQLRGASESVRNDIAARRRDLQNRMGTATRLGADALRELEELEPRIAALPDNPDSQSALESVRGAQADLKERQTAAEAAVAVGIIALDEAMESITAYDARIDRLLSADTTPAEMVAALAEVRAETPVTVTEPVSAASLAVQALGLSAQNLREETGDIASLLPALPMPSPGGPTPTPGGPTPTPGGPMPTPGGPMPTPARPRPAPAGNGSMGHSTGHSWGDGWFKMLNAGAPGSDDVDGVDAIGISRPFPATPPADYDTLSYTEQVATTSLFAPPLRTFGFRFYVPLPGDYEVIIAWRELFFSAAGKRIMDVSVGTDVEPHRVLIRDLDVWSKTQGNRSVVTAHLPGCGHKSGGFEAASWVEVHLTGKVEGPIVNAVIVRQVPLFEAGSDPTRMPGSLPPAGTSPSPAPTMTVRPRPTRPSTPAPVPTPAAPAPSASVAPVPTAVVPAPTAEVTPQPTPLSSIKPVRINMGGPAVNDFIADVDAFAPGTRLGNAFTARGDAIGSVGGVDQTIRWNQSLSYELPVPAPGMYEVTIASVELFFSNVGERIFNVSVEVEGVETLLASGVDLVSDFGELQRATWTTGPLRIERAVTVRLVGEEDNACVSAIWMSPVMTTVPPAQEQTF